MCPRPCTRLWSYNCEINRPELRSWNWTTHGDFLLGWPSLPPHYPFFMDTLASCPSVWSLRMLHSINYLHSFLKGSYALSLLSMRTVSTRLLISKYCHISSTVFLSHHTHCYLSCDNISCCQGCLRSAITVLPGMPSPFHHTFCDLLIVDSYGLSPGSCQLELVCFMSLNGPFWHATSLSLGISSSMAALVFHFMGTIRF